MAKGVSFDGDAFFILDVLDHEHFVLKEVCED